MSEITDDYLSDSNVHRWKVTAKAASLPGTGSKNTTGWLLTENELPAELIDSDNVKSEASGAPTLRSATDEGGINQVGLFVQDFTPASGGGTATLWIEAQSYTGGTNKDFWLFWITGGSQTQPAASALYGSEQVFSNAEFFSVDGGQTDESGNYTPTVSGAVNGSQFDVGSESAEFDGTNDDIELSITSDPTQYTLLAMVRPDNVVSRNIIVRTNSSGPTSAWSHQLRINSSSQAEHYLFDAGATATRTLPGTTTLSTATWYMLAGTVANGGNMRLYVDGSEEGASLSITSLWTAGDRFKIGDDSGNGMNHYDGHIGPIVYIDSEFDSDEIAAVSNAWQDTANFWDTTNAVEDGPFDIDPERLFESMWTAKGAAYQINIIEPGASATTQTFKIVSDVRVRRGSPNYSPLEPILESQLEFTIRDDNKAFRAAIAGKEIGEVLVEYTKDSSVIFKGPLIPSYQRSLEWLDSPKYKVSAYDGINGLKGFTWDITGSKTLRQLLHECADKIGLELTLNCVFETKHSGADVSTDPLDALQVRAEHLLSEGSTYHDVLTMLCRFFGANFFQSAGQWYFMERVQRDGMSMTNYPTNSSGAAQTNVSVNWNFGLGASDLHRRDTYFDYHAATARFQSAFKYPNYLLKNADWSEGNKYWDNNGSDFVATNLSPGREININNGYLSQTVGTTLIDSDTLLDKIYFGFDVRVNINALATGVHDFEYAQIRAIHDNGDIEYLSSPSFTWGSTPVRLTQSIDFGANAGSHFPFSPTINTAKIPFTPCRIELEFYFDKDATGNLAHIDSVEFGEVTVEHLKPDPEDDVFRPEELVTTDTSGNLGDNLEEEFIVGDTATKYNGIGIFEYYDGTDWIPTSDWDGSGQTIHELRVANLKQQLESRMELYEFSHMFGDAPDLHNALTYASSGTTGKVYVPVFIEQIYARNASVKTRSAAIEQLGASVEVLYLSDVWFTATEVSSTPAPDSGVYKYEIPNESENAPWVFDLTPWANNLITSDSTGITHIRADREAGYLFSVGYFAQEIKRTALDGSSPYSPSSSITAWNIALNRANSSVIVYDLSTFSEYDYDLNLIGVIYTKPTGSLYKAGTPGVGQSGDYMFFQESKSGFGSYERVSQIDLTTLIKTDLFSTTTLGFAGFDNNTILVDEEYGKVFLSASIGTGAYDVYTFDYPSGTSPTKVLSAVSSGLALDRLNEKILYTDVNGNVLRSNYDGTGEETIIDGPTSLEVLYVDIGLS